MSGEMMVSITLQFIAGPRHTIFLPTPCSVDAIVRAAEHAFGPLAAEGIKVVLKGAALPADKPAQLVTMKDGDVLLVAPQRKAPPPDIVAAVTSARRKEDDDNENDDDEHVTLPPGTPLWEVAVVEALRTRAGCPDWLLEWVVLLRPRRLVLMVAFLIGCVVASRLSLGPLFILACLIAAIFSNLGTRRAGEMSAYSIFNRGVRRLPGQLDADEIDRQMRQGQMG